MGVLENQITMMKTSCGEVVKTLKEEIADLMEDRTQMELDLLNQLSKLDNEKRRAELDFQLQLQVKDETIERLRSHHGDIKVAASTDVEELEEEIRRLRELNRQAKDTIERERSEADQMIHQLEEEKTRLERKLEAASDDLDVLRHGQNAKETIQVLERISKEREAVNLSMTRVASVWELADASVSNLEDVMDQLRPHDTTEVTGDREKVLSTLESASLVHGQIKISLMLIELKLRNQLQCLKNHKMTMGWSASNDQEMTRTMEEIQQGALTALSQVEAALSNQMYELEQKALKETAELKDQLRDRLENLSQMQEEYNELVGQVSKLRTSNNGSDCFVETPSSSQNGKPEENKIAVSQPVLNQLQAEIIRIVERIQAKNDIIASLKKELEEHKVREENLKKELKRVLRANTAAAALAKETAAAAVIKSKVKKEQSPFEEQQKQKLVPPMTPVKSPMKLKKVVLSNADTYQVKRYPFSKTDPSSKSCLQWNSPNPNERYQTTSTKSS